MKELFKPPQIGRSTAVKDFAYPVSHPKHVVAILPPEYNAYECNATRRAYTAQDSLDCILSRAISKPVSSTTVYKQLARGRSLDSQNLVETSLLSRSISCISPRGVSQRSFSVAALDQKATQNSPKLEDSAFIPLVRYLPQAIGPVTGGGSSSHLSNNLEALRLRDRRSGAVNLRGNIMTPAQCQGESEKVEATASKLAVKQKQTDEIHLLKEHIVSGSNPKIESLVGKQLCARVEEGNSADIEANIDGPLQAIIVESQAECHQSQKFINLERQDSTPVLNDVQPHILLSKFGDILWNSEDPGTSSGTVHHLRRLLNDANTRHISPRLRKNSSKSFMQQIPEN